MLAAQIQAPKLSAAGAATCHGKQRSNMPKRTHVGRVIYIEQQAPGRAAGAGASASHHSAIVLASQCACRGWDQVAALLQAGTGQWEQQEGRPSNLELNGGGGFGGLGGAVLALRR